MKKLCVSLILAAFVLQSARGAVDLKQSRLTQVINSVEIISSNARHSAEVNDVFKMPDVMRTGAGARAEMIADDGTLTRVGANTIFSFDPAERTINLDQGSLLFHAPHGKGGGTIRTGSATASVIGTTIIVTTTPNGGFKVLDLEGEAEIRFLDGLHEKLTPGQMVFILPGGGASPVVVFRLDVETEGSLLVNGFKDPLPSWPQIQAEITRQLTLLIDDRIIDTDLVVGDNATPQTVQVVMNLQGHPLDNSSIVGVDPVSTLPVNYPQLDSKFTKTGPFKPPGNFSEGLNFVYGGPHTPGSGFVGKNIDIDTGEPGESGVSINLAPFSGDTDFDIMAQQNIRIWRSVNFITEEDTAAVSENNLDAVGIFAGGQMEIAQDASITAHTGILGLVAGGFDTLDTDNGQIADGGDNTLEGVEVENYGGAVKILSKTDLTWGDYGYVYGYGDVDISSDGSLTLGIGDTVSRAGDFEYDFEADSYQGSINLNAVDDVDTDDAELDAGLDLNITAGGAIGDLAYGGDIDIYGSDLYAGDSDFGGNASITAVNGNVDIEYSDIEAYAEGSYDEGSINITAGNGEVYIYDTSLYAEGDVDITSNGANDEEGIDIEDSNDIEAGYDDSIGGNITLDAANDEVYLYDDTLEAYSEDNSTGGNININAEDGDVYIYDADLHANQNVSMMSCGTDNDTGIYIDEVDIEAGWDNSDGAGGNVYIEGYNGDVTIDDADIYASSGYNADGDVNVYAGGTGYIFDTYIDASGDVSIESVDSLTVDSDNSEDIDAGGSISLISDNSNVYVNYYGLYSGGDVDITSGGDLEDGEDSTQNGIDIEDSDIEAAYYGENGANVNINAYNGAVTIYDSYISASADGDFGEGNININAYDGEALIYGGEVYASGDVSITSSGVDNGEGIDIEKVSIEAGTDDSIGGNVTMDANNNEVYLYENGVYAYAQGNTSEGNININAEDGDVYIDYGNDIYAAGSVNIMSCGTDNGTGIDIEDGTTIEAGYDDSVGGNVNINAYNGDLTINGDETSIVSIEAYEGFENEGDVDIYTTGSGDIQNTYIYADNTVDIETADCLTVNSSGSEQTIEGYYGVTLESDYAGVSINHYDIQADYGDAAIYAEGKICIMDDSSIYGGYYDSNPDSVDITSYDANVSLTGDSTIDASGNVCISAGPDDTSGSAQVYVGGSYIYAGDGSTSGGSAYINASADVSIEDGSTVDAANDVDITSGEFFNTDGDETATPGSIDIEDSDIYAGDDGSTGGGNVNIKSYNGEVYLYDNGVYAYAQDNTGEGNININAEDGDVYIDSDNTIQADGNVNIMSCGTDNGTGVSIYDSYIDAGYGDSVEGGNVNINAYNGSAYLSDDSISATEADSVNGEINITAEDNIDVLYSMLCAPGGVSLVANNGYVNVYNSYESGFLNINDWYISAGTEVDISADDSVSISDGSTIYANGGDININSGGEISPDFIISDDADISGSYLWAADSVNVTANGGNINITGGTSVYAADGSINLTASDSGYGGIDIDSSTIEANGNVSMTADSDITIQADSLISASSGNTVDGEEISGDEVYISSGGTLTIDGNGGSHTDIFDNSVDYDIGADTSVSLYGDSGVNLNDAVITTLDGSSDDEITVTADGKICITGGSSLYSGGSVWVEAYDGNVKINNSDITANNGSVYISSDYGMLSINEGHDFNIPSDISEPKADIAAFDDGVYADAEFYGDCVSITDTAIYADDGVIVNGESGGVTITDADIETDNGDIDMYAYNTDLGSGNGNLELTSGSANYGVYLSASGNISLGADSDVTIQDSGIFAGTGNIDINAGQDLSIEDDGSDNGNWIETGSDGTSTGSITMTAGGDAYIYDSYISADQGNVCITAQDELTIEGGDNYSSVAGNNVNLTAATGGVNIEDGETVSANNGDLTIDAGGTKERFLSVHFPSGSNPTGAFPGGVSPADTTIDGGGSTDEEPGSIDISDSGSISLSAITYIADNGTLSVNAGSDITLDGVNLYAYVDGVVSLDSGSDMNISDTDISADEDVSITSGGSFAVTDSSIYAGGGNVEITALALPGSSSQSYPGGTIDIEDTYINANGDIDITSSGSLTIGVTSGETLNATGEIDLASDYSGIEVDDYSVYSYGNGIYANALFDIGLSDDYMEAYNGSISFNASGDVNLYDDDIYADEGNICIMSGYNAYNGVDIEDSDIEASGNVGISAWESVTMGDSDSDYIDAGKSLYITSEYGMGGGNPSIGIYDSTLEADNGGVTISSPYGTVDLEFADIYANEDNTVYVDDADLNATGNVDINAHGGNVDITAGYEIDFNEDFFKDEIGPETDIYMGGDITIQDNSSVVAGNGDSGVGGIYINSTGSLNISAPYVYAAGLYIEGGNIDISESDLQSSYGDIDIKDCGNVNINAGDFGLFFVGIDVKNIDICDSYVTAYDGNINIENTGSLSISSVDTDSENYEIDASEINITSSLIAATSGNVTISTPGDIDLDDAVISASVDNTIDSVPTATGDSITVTAGGYLTVTGQFGSYGYDYDIGADTSITLQGNSGVDIEGAVVETLDGSPDDSLQISSSGGDVTINNSFIGSYGNVDISSGDTLSIDAGHDYSIPDRANSGFDYDVYAGGTLTLDAVQDASVEDTSIHSGSDLTLTAENGNVYLEDTALQSDGNVYISSPYGNITMEAGGAEYGVTISAAGEVLVNANQGVSLSQTDIISTGGDVDISSLGTEEDAVASSVAAGGGHVEFGSAAMAKAGDVSGLPAVLGGKGGSHIGPAYSDTEATGDIDYSALDIEDSGTIALDAQAGAVNLTDTTLDAYGGPVSITADTTVDIEDSGVYSYSGDVSVSSAGTADIEDSDLGANGNVSVESGDTLTFDDSDIYAIAGGASLTADAGDLDMDASDIYAYQGGVSLTASQGAIDIEDSDVYAFGGCIMISGASDVYVDDSDLLSFNNGISISSSGSTLEIEDSYIYAGGNLHVSSADMLSVDTGHDFDDEYDYNYTGPGYFDIYSTGNINMTGGTCASVVDTTMFAQGNLMISGQDGNVLIEDSDIETGSGNLCVSSADDLTMDSGETDSGIYVEAGGSVNLSAEGDVEIDPDGDYNDAIYADGGDLNITSYNAGVDVENMNLSASGNVNITAEGSFSIDLIPSTPVDVNLNYDSLYTGTGGAVTLTSDYGDVNVQNTYISAGSSVNFEAGTANDNDEFVYLYNDNIYAGTSITLSAPDGIYISSGGSTEDITAYDGGVSIQAGDGSAYISGMDINSRELSSISITDSSDIEADGNVNIGAEGGSVDIAAGDSLTEENVAVNIGGDIAISGSTITADTGEVNITSTGTISITAPGSVFVLNSSVSGDNIDITGSTITAATDVNINNGNDESIIDSGGYDLSELNNLDITEDSDITAQNGNVNIGTDGNIDVDTSVIEADGTTPSSLGVDVPVVGTITLAAGGNIDVDYSDLSASAGVGLTAGGYVSVLNSLDVPGFTDDYNLTVDDWSVTAGTYANIEADNNLTVEGSTITANGGDVTLRSGTAIITGGLAGPPTFDLTIEDGTTVSAYGSIYARANEGNNDIYDSTLTAQNGSVDIYASQNMDIEDTTITVEEPDIVYSSGSSISSDYIDISSTGGNIEFDANGTTTLTDDTFNLGPNIHISGTDVTAETGNVYIGAGLFEVGSDTTITDCTFNQNTGNVVIDTGSDIVSIESDVTIDAGNNITIGDSTISATPDGSDADISTSDDNTSVTISSQYGDINLSAAEGNVVINNSTFNLGGNVNITGASVDASGGDVDLNAGQLNISAGGTIDMSSSTINGGQINITAGSDVSASGNVNMTAETVNVADSQVTANNNINIDAAGAVNISSTSSVTPDTTIQAGGTGVTIDAQNGVTVSTADITATGNNGSITINNASGETTIDHNAQLQAFYININSDDGILIDGGLSGSGGTLNANAGLGTAADDLDNGHTVAIQDQDLSGFATVNVQGHTVNLSGDNFSSSGNYNFTSFHHGYYVGGTVAGYVNFNNDTLDHTAITTTGGDTSSTLNPANNGGIELGGTGAGIHIN